MCLPFILLMHKRVSISFVHHTYSTFIFFVYCSLRFDEVYVVFFHLLRNASFDLAFVHSIFCGKCQKKCDFLIAHTNIANLSNLTPAFVCKLSNYFTQNARTSFEWKNFTKFIELKLLIIYEKKYMAKKSPKNGFPSIFLLVSLFCFIRMNLPQAHVSCCVAWSERCITIAVISS